ncbi:UDP-glycosyltransferase 87A1 isoform X2 [Pyrus x bretschneideri]|uniref:UDP-glycosyltransferase 87A1 isoform X2 n=1 Tax=Pyrus x bretschneideri TaxID=225117 RepID=UPI00203082F0|nr:UDP-glycosyltransferase 87A1 isoform X2 [Pyrus x bretschneideri]
MDSTSEQQRTSVYHVVAVPHPSRSHIYSLMNFCKLLASQEKDILVTFVLTQEWLGLIGSDSKPDSIRFTAIPNVIPSEHVRVADMDAFLDAVRTKMEKPFELLLDQLEQPPSLIVADTILHWAVAVGNRRNIPAASFWPMSASSWFSLYQHFHLFSQNEHFPANLLEKGNERVDYIPGVSSTRLADLLAYESNQKNVDFFLNLLSWVPKAQYLLFAATFYELETLTIDVLRSELSLPIYTMGPSIPYSKKNDLPNPATSDDSYFQWLDSQPCSSVLYIGMGSFLSFSSAQIDEIAASLRNSGVRFIWAARGESERLKEACGDMGLVVPWCDQLRVLRHSSIGGFLSHCGWNSVMEGVSAGVIFLTLPIGYDQGMNSKQIVEDWKVGWRVRKIEDKIDHLVTKEEIAGLMKKFMDLEDDEGKEMRRRARELKQLCHDAIAEGGSSHANIKAFIGDISHRA